MKGEDTLNTILEEDRVKKAYVCNRWPNLKIGDRVAFQGGLYETDNPDEQRLIESRDYYGIHVHPKDVEPSPQEGQEAQQAQEGGGVKTGRRGTR